MDFRQTFHVVVIGAGLVGLATAILLNESGYNVTVLEQETELREVRDRTLGPLVWFNDADLEDQIGAGIQLAPNATRVLDEIGILQKVIASSVQPPAMVLQSYRTGKVLHSLSLDPHSQKTYGTPYLVIHRADFRRILFDEAAARSVHVRFGVQIDLTRTDFGRGVIRLAKDAEEIEADLVIGADGAHSVCRQALLKRPDPPRPSGTLVNRIVIDAELLSKNTHLKTLISPPNVQCWLGPESLAICYLLKGVYNIALTRPQNEQQVFFGPQPVDMDDLRSFFSDWDPRIQELIDIAHVFQKWSLLVNEQPASWVHPDGRFVLVGDAVHLTLPYLAQGSSMGLESASVLSNLLAKAHQRADIPKILSLYNSIREPRTRHVTLASNKTRSTWQMPNGPLQIERDKQLIEEDPPSAGYPNMLGDPIFQAWLWGFDARATVERAWAWANTKNGERLVANTFRSSLQWFS